MKLFDQIRNLFTVHVDHEPTKTDLQKKETDNLDDEKKGPHDDKPILLLERMSDKIGLKRWYLYPVPLIAVFTITSFLPHLYLELYGPTEWSEYFDDFDVTWGWVILITVVSYGSIIFRRTYVSKLYRLHRDGIIPHPKVYEAQINHLVSWKFFLPFLIFFELMVGYFWYNDVLTDWNVVSNSEFILEIPGIVIQIFVLPFAAETFAAALSGSLLPHRLRTKHDGIEQIKIDPLHQDKHGGAKPFGDIMLVIEYVYIGAIVISLLLFQEFRSTPIVWGPFVVILVGLIFAPQIHLRKMLSKTREKHLYKIHAVYSKCFDSLGPKLYHEDKSGSLHYSPSFLTFVKMAKDQVESMKTWSFDLVALYKAITILISLPFLQTVLDPYVQQIALP